MPRTALLPLWPFTREGCGWGVSAMLHAGGALVLAALPHVVVEPPRLPGSDSAITLELRAYSTEHEREPPDERLLPAEWTQAPAEALHEPPIDVVVTPEHVQIAERGFRIAAVDLARPAVVDASAAAEPAQSREPSRRAPARTKPADVPESATPPLRMPPSAAHSSVPQPAVPRVTVPRPIGVDATIAPRPLDNRPPHYPDVALRNRWEGTVVLLLHVTDDGAVDDVRVHSPSGHSALDAAAVQAVKSWRFEPARRAGKPIDYRLRLPVMFQR